MARSGLRLDLAVVLVVASTASCRTREPASAPERAPHPPVAAAEQPHDRELAALRAFEDRRRAATDFAALPPSDAVLGPDPYRIAALPGTPTRWVGLLRG